MLATIKVHGTTREAFLLRSTLAAAAAYGTTSASGLVAGALARSADHDVDILNYAVTLQYVQSAFYGPAATEVDGLSREDGQLVRRLRDDADAHVEALTAAIKDLGGRVAATPTFAFGDALASRAAFLKTASMLADTAASAYNGAATSIASADVLATAAAIAQVEARHAALIRLARDRTPAPQAFDEPSTMEEALASVQPFVTA